MKKIQLLVSIGMVFGLSACQQPSSIEDMAESVSLESASLKSASLNELPNIVFILADDLGYGDVGVYGATLVDTPNIDRLAENGRLFTDAHSASAVCTPSRYALLTGEYPLKAETNTGRGKEGLWGPSGADKELLIDPEKMNLGHMLQEKGYNTAAIGKWHLGFKEGMNDWQVPLSPGPRDIGFNYYYGMPVVNSSPPYVYVENETVVGHDPSDPLINIRRLGDDQDAPEPSPARVFPEEASIKTPNYFSGALEAHKLFDDEQVGTIVTEKAIEWMDDNKEDPFFLYFPTTQIHHPFTPAPRFQGTSEIGLYGDFIHELDWMVGELVGYLEDNDLIDNTLVIFTSDNGGMLNLGGRIAVENGHKLNGDLLGFKFGAWEGGHRVPFIAQWPGKIKAGEISDQLISLIDMMASFASLTGQEEYVPANTDSVNVLPALLGEEDGQIRQDLVVAPSRPQNLAFREGEWVYIGAQGSGGFTGSEPQHHAWGGPAGVNLVGGENSDMKDGQLLSDAPPAQLYNLKDDPYQKTNLYHQHPEIVERMEARLSEYLPREAR